METAIEGFTFIIPKSHIPEPYAVGCSVGVKVLATPEIFEHILLHLDMKDILISCLRVNKSWNATITNSPQLQQALFFKPIARSPKVSVIVDETKCEDTQLGRTPTLNWTNPPPCTVTREELAVNEARFSSNHIRRNPICRRTIGLRNGVSNKDHSTAYARPEASWRKMLVSQPPVEFITGGRELMRLGDFGDARQTYAWLWLIQKWTEEWQDLDYCWSRPKIPRYDMNGMRLLLDRKKWLNPSLALLPWHEGSDES